LVGRADDEQYRPLMVAVMEQGVVPLVLRLYDLVQFRMFCLLLVLYELLDGVLMVPDHVDAVTHPEE
jgi:hypothetical protein